MEESVEWEEVLGSDVMFKRISPGQGPTAEMGTLVTCDYRGYFNDDESPFEVMTNQRFKIGETDTFPGLELALRHSSVGETLRVKVNSRFAYGPDGRPAWKAGDGREVPAIPANSDLEYEVTIISHVADGGMELSVLPESLQHKYRDFDPNDSESSSLLTAIYNQIIPFDHNMYVTFHR